MSTAHEAENDLKVLTDQNENNGNAQACITHLLQKHASHMEIMYHVIVVETSTKNAK